MKKQEFMSRLEQELTRKLPQEHCREILADFEEHFKEALLVGESEEKVCETLGDPAEIAAQCIESRLWAPEPAPEAGRAETAESSGIRRLLVNILDVNLVCAPCTGEAFRVEVRKNNIPVEDEEIHVRTRGDSFEVIQDQDPKRFFMNRLFRLPENKTVYVDVPVSFHGEIEIRVTSGNARLMDLAEAERIFCDVKSGNITMEKLTAREGFQVGAKSGNVKLSDCTGDIHGDSFSGNVELSRCRGDAEVGTKSGNTTVSYHKGNVSGHCMSGNVRVATDTIDRDSRFSSKSGTVNVEVERLAADLVADCVSGGIKLTVGRLEGNITAKTISGSVSATLNPGTEAEFRLKGSGKEKQFFTGRGEGLPVVTLTATSGSAKVHGPALSW